jgi:hypothetical protein
VEYLLFFGVDVGTGMLYLPWFNNLDALKPLRNWFQVSVGPQWFIHIIQNKP